MAYGFVIIYLDSILIYSKSYVKAALVAEFVRGHSATVYGPHWRL